MFVWWDYCVESPVLCLVHCRCLVKLGFLSLSYPILPLTLFSITVVLAYSTNQRQLSDVLFKVSFLMFFRWWICIHYLEWADDLMGSLLDNIAGLNTNTLSKTLQKYYWFLLASNSLKEISFYNNLILSWTSEQWNTYLHLSTYLSSTYLHMYLPILV